jgi:hypothetical protein
MFCERCGLNFLPKQSVCNRCGDIATRHWLQMISLSTLMVVVVCNTLIGILLLPRHIDSHVHGTLFHAWLWVDYKIARFGWIPLAVALLAWDFLVWQSRPKVKAWVTRKLLTFTLIASVTPFIPTWIPAGQPPQNFVAKLGLHPGLPSALAWGAVLFVMILLCLNSETRDLLLGHGKILSLVSFGLLLFLLVLTILGWSMA